MSFHIDEIQSLSTYGLPSLNRRWQLVGACVVCSMIVALLFVMIKPVSFTASTQLLIYLKEVQPGPDLIVSTGRADLTQVENEIEIIRSRGTLAKVVQALKLADDREFVPAMTLFQMSTQWLFGSPLAASDESRRRQEVAIEALARKIAVKRVGTSHTILVSVTTSDPKNSERIANDISQVMLQARVSAEQDGIRSPLQRERLQGLGPSAYVLTPALAPKKPNGPRKVLIVLGAAIAGFLAGSVLALLLDVKNKAIRTAAQIEHFGLECIGPIPFLKGNNHLRSASEPGKEDVLLQDPLTHQTLLRITTAIDAARVRFVGVASSIEGEGSTNVARNLVQMVARERTVLLVEPDCSGAFRFFSAERCFDLRELTSVVADQQEAVSINTANWRAHCDPDVLAAYDLVVVCLPPLERGAEFRMAADGVEGTLLVIRWGNTQAERLERAFEVSRVVPEDFIGAVLNMVDHRMIGRFGDRLWQAEAKLVRRRSFGLGVSIAGYA